MTHWVPVVVNGEFPLRGIGLTELAGHNFFHDGRARNLKEAILWHGGEGARSRDYFKNYH